jgi:hypothetical protein
MRGKKKERTGAYHQSKKILSIPDEVCMSDFIE